MEGHRYVRFPQKPSKHTVVWPAPLNVPRGCKRQEARLTAQAAGCSPVVTGPCSAARGEGWFRFSGVITVAAVCLDAEWAPLGHGLTSQAVCLSRPRTAALEARLR